MSIWKIGISEDEMEDSNGSYDGNSDADTGDNAEALPYDEQRALTAAAGFLCSDNVSPKVFRDGGPFRQFMGLLNPLFKPSCAEIESKCMEIYVEKSLKVKNILENLDGQISLSLDILSAGDADGVFYDYYLCFSAHFIDENWKPMKLVLYYRSLSLPDSVDDIPHEDEDWGIFRSAADWGIASKISTLTMTNDCYYNEMVESVKTHIQEKKVLELNGQLFRVYCCGEIIAEMVQGAFEMIENTMDKIRELISFNFMFPLWHLTNSKLKDALDSWSEGEFSSQDVIDHYDVPSPEEWSKVEGVWKVVDSIYEVSHALFETKPLTANVYLYHLHEIRKILVQMSTDSDSFIRTIVEGMLEKFSKYWDDMFLMLAITAALDPRFKMKYVEFVFSEVQGTEGKSQGASVFESIHELFDNYVLHFPEKESFISDSSSPDSNSEEESPPPAKNANHTFSVLQDYQKFIQMNDQPAKKSELDCYLEEPVLSWTEDFDALIWWRTASAKYPTLSRMARDFLAIPISLGTSHKAFYSEPRPADRFLVGVKPDLMNALKCTRSWSPLY